MSLHDFAMILQGCRNSLDPVWIRGERQISFLGLHIQLVPD